MAPPGRTQLNDIPRAGLLGRTSVLRSLSPMGTWKPQSGRKGGLIERTPGRDERGIARRKRTPRGTEPGARAHRRGRGSATRRQEGVGPGAAGQAAEHPRPAGVVGVVAHEPFEHSAAGAGSREVASHQAGAAPSQRDPSLQPVPQAVLTPTPGPSAHWKEREASCFPVALRLPLLCVP